MSKSLGNVYTVNDLIEKGYNPMHFRYLVLNSHYKKGLVFSWKSLDSAKNAYEKLRELLISWRSFSRESLSNEKLDKIDQLRYKFIQKLGDDLNYPQALAVVWEVAKSNIPNSDKLDLILEFDQVLGLRLSELSKEIEKPEVEEEVNKLLKKREILRNSGEYSKADRIRLELKKRGYLVEDRKEGAKVKKI